jgi:hypothetical protein
MNILFILLSLSGVILIIFMLRKLKFSQILLSVFSGLSALFCCDLIMSFTGTDFMPVNFYTLSVSALGGIPGVILLVLLKMLM